MILDYCFHLSKEFKFARYSDSNWDRDMEDKKITIDFVFYMGDIVFTWTIKKQLIMTLHLGS